MKLPRKLKKKLKKGFWFYPKKDNGYLYATPHKLEQDFIAWKKGILINLRNFNRLKYD